MLLGQKPLTTLILFDYQLMVGEVHQDANST